MGTLSEMLVKIKMQPFSHLNSQTPLISIYGSPMGTIGLRNLCARNRELSKAIRGRERKVREGFRKTPGGDHSICKNIHMRMSAVHSEN